MVSSFKQESGFAVAWSVVAILGLIIIVSVGVLLAGYGYAGFKSPDQQAKLSSNVCKATDIEKYNSLANPANKTTDRDAFVNNIKGREGYADDATCAFMLAQLYIVSNNAEAARPLVDRLTQLASNGISPDARLNDLSSITQLQATLNATNTDGTAPVGQG